MKFRRQTFSQILLGLSSLMLVIGCQQMPTDDPDTIGRLETSGPSVRVNGRPASSGMSLQNRDYVETGGGSEALIRFRDGSLVRMDESTDPSFWLEWVSTARCLIHYVISSGRVGASTGDCDHVVTDPDGNEWLAGSQYVVSREADTSRFTLLSGRAQMRQPRNISIRPGSRVTVTRGTVVAVERVDPDEIRRLQSWLRGAGIDQPEPGRLTPIPALTGLALSDARRELERTGLRLGQVQQKQTRSMEPGTIISQSPTPRTRVPRGSSVSVVVAERQVYCTVPDIEGLQFEQAQKLLRDAGLRWRVTARYEYDTNRVSRVEPRAGTRIRCAQVVEIQLGVIG